MKFRKKSVVAVALSAMMACGVLAGCDGLTTTDARKDYEQVVAEVNISNSANFAEGGEFAAYKDVIATSEITKRDLVSSFASQGSSLAQSGYSYAEIFDSICDRLINSQVYIQYAKVYFLQKGDTEGNEYTVAGYQAAVAAANEANKDASARKQKIGEAIAGLGYFLTEEERAKAEYDLKVSVNDALDTQEESIIAEEDDHDHDETVRTTPTGIDTENEDYCAANYEIYTGTGSRHAADCGEYEPVDGSTVTTRRKAYTSFLSNLRSYALLYEGENTSEITGLTYYSMELKNAYETAILNKLTDCFEKEAEDIISDTATGDWIAQQFAGKLQSQIDGYKEDTDAFETALDGISDTSFVLAAPEANYGFVINILLPFSESNSQELENSPFDAGDQKGNKFAQRAAILKKVKATDQRGTWFTGHDDYSFEAAEGKGYTGTLDNSSARKYLFFEDSLPTYSAGVYVENENGKDEILKNYYGQYTYNGTVSAKEEDGHTHYTLTPKKIDIDGFIAEMEGYLKYAGLTLGTPTSNKAGYYNKKAADYYKKTDGSATDWTKVDYEQFVYYEGSVNLPDYDANELFLPGTDVNKAFSVINELSFAYNTDTAGLNSYLGYAVSPGKTDFVPEFEYAAQKAVKAGAGHYIVAPSDYGWHIMYCTFSFKDANTTPFEYKDAEKETEGTFSYLFYESIKAQNLSAYSSKMQTQIITEYADEDSGCFVKYEKRYADLSNLG